MYARFGHSIRWNSYSAFPKGFSALSLIFFLAFSARFGCSLFVVLTFCCKLNSFASHDDFYAQNEPTNGRWMDVWMDYVLASANIIYLNTCSFVLNIVCEYRRCERTNELSTEKLLSMEKWAGVCYCIFSMQWLNGFLYAVALPRLHQCVYRIPIAYFCINFKLKCSFNLPLQREIKYEIQLLHSFRVWFVRQNPPRLEK